MSARLASVLHRLHCWPLFARMKPILALLVLASLANAEAPVPKSAAEVGRALYPDQAPPRTRGRGASPAAVAPPIVLTQVTRTAVVSVDGLAAMTRTRGVGDKDGESIRHRGPQPVFKIISEAGESSNSQSSRANGGSSPSNAPKTAKVEVQVYKETMAAFSNIHFELGSTRFADEASKQQVANIAEVLRDHPQDCYVVEGHTCDRGGEADNQILSLNRAQTVANHLIRAGVQSQQLVVLGFGESDLLDRPKPDDSPEQAEAKRAPNRRVAVGRVAQQQQLP
jgi:outer membrane protein OmpA-like peptidoglycan-associated protein